jgi:hypothetical protein
VTVLLSPYNIYCTFDNDKDVPLFTLYCVIQSQRASHYYPRLTINHLWLNQEAPHSVLIEPFRPLRGWMKEHLSRGSNPWPFRHKSQHYHSSTPLPCGNPKLTGSALDLADPNILIFSHVGSFTLQWYQNSHEEKCADYMTDLYIGVNN